VKITCPSIDIARRFFLEANLSLTHPQSHDRIIAVKATNVRQSELATKPYRSYTYKGIKVKNRESTKPEVICIGTSAIPLLVNRIDCFLISRSDINIIRFSPSL
jgi:hypothetical protein